MPVSVTERECIGCGAVFAAAHQWFCTAECRASWHDLVGTNEARVRIKRGGAVSEVVSPPDRAPVPIEVRRAVLRAMGAVSDRPVVAVARVPGFEVAVKVTPTL